MIIVKKYIFFLLLLCGFSVRIYSQEAYIQTGIATYYSDAFHGRKTSCGEIYNNMLYTAAHATLPFQTIVKITNFSNDSTVIVRINDRCPNYPNRIIDLSKAAAKKINIIYSGIARVKIEVVLPADSISKSIGSGNLKK